MKTYILSKDLDSLIVRKLDDVGEYSSIKNLRLVNKKISLLVNQTIERIFKEKYSPLLKHIDAKNLIFPQYYFYTVKYIEKLKNEYKIDYIPLSFERCEPRSIYKSICNKISKKRWRVIMRISKEKNNTLEDINYDCILDLFISLNFDDSFRLVSRHAIALGKLNLYEEIVKTYPKMFNNFIIPELREAVASGNIEVFNYFAKKLDKPYHSNMPIGDQRSTLIMKAEMEKHFHLIPLINKLNFKV